MEIEKRWMKASEVAAYLSLNEKSVYRACRHGQIPSSKAPGIGVRVDKLKLDAMLERMGISPKEFGNSLKSKE